LRNEGTAHGIIADANLTISVGGMTKKVSSDAFKGQNILAGSERRFLLPWPEGFAVGPVQADLKLDVER